MKNERRHPRCATHLGLNRFGRLARRVLSAAFPLLAIVSAAHASTWVVDDDGGPGVDFTDIQPAIFAAAPGDLILVHPGSYSDFVLSKGLTILGNAPGVVVDPGSRVSVLPAAQRAVLARIGLRDLRVTGCAGTVLLDEVVLPHPSLSSLSQLLTVEGSADVRLFDVTVDTFAGGDTGKDGTRLVSSRVELVQSTIRGDGGTDTDCGTGGPGGRGLVGDQGARLHVVASDVLGGEGGSNFATCVSFCNLGAGDGNDGMAVFGSSTRAILAGSSAHRVEGGFEGDGGECACDGHPGAGLRVSNGLVLYSGISILGGGSFCSGPGPAIQTSGTGSAIEVMPPDPYLGRTLIPTPGGQVRFAIFGVAGDAVTLKLGRSPVVQPLPGVEIEQLTTEERSIPVGIIGGSGNVTLLLSIPGNLPQGFGFYAQAVIQRGGAELRTNSVPIVLR